MRETPWIAAEPYRIQLPDRRSQYGDAFGCFRIPFSRTNVTLGVIVSNGDYVAAMLPKEYAWEHVSVSLPNRCPNWPEMDFICRIFWKDDETVMQLHGSKDDHINIHQNCLHLWRPLRASIPLPPKGAV